MSAQSRVMISKRVKVVSKQGTLADLLHDVNQLARSIPTVRDLQIRQMTGKTSDEVAAQITKSGKRSWVGWLEEDIVIANDVKTPAPNTVQFADFEAKTPEALAVRINEFAVKHEVTKITILWSVDGWTALIRYGVFTR